MEIMDWKFSGMWAEKLVKFGRLKSLVRCGQLNGKKTPQKQKNSGMWKEIGLKNEL